MLGTIHHDTFNLFFRYHTSKYAFIIRLPDRSDFISTAVPARGTWRSRRPHGEVYRPQVLVCRTPSGQPPVGVAGCGPLRQGLSAKKNIDDVDPWHHQRERKEKGNIFVLELMGGGGGGVASCLGVTVVITVTIGGWGGEYFCFFLFCWLVIPGSFCNEPISYAINREDTRVAIDNERQTSNSEGNDQANTFLEQKLARLCFDANRMLSTSEPQTILACSAREACCTKPASPASAAKDTTVCSTRLSAGCWAMSAPAAADVVPLPSPLRCLTAALETSPFTPRAPCLGAGGRNGEIIFRGGVVIGFGFRRVVAAVRCCTLVHTHT